MRAINFISVRAGGIGPPTSVLSGQRSTIELRTQFLHFIILFRIFPYRIQLQPRATNSISTSHNLQSSL